MKPIIDEQTKLAEWQNSTVDSKMASSVRWDYQSKYELI
jgi:hypothetical protein